MLVPVILISWSLVADMWRPDSLLEAIDETVSFPKDSGGRNQCPNCKVFRVAACILDVRQLPMPEDWACDVCWTHWERTGRVVDGGAKIDTDARFDWRLRWAIAHNAPQEIIDKWTP